jgi:hypothetical protein
MDSLIVASALIVASSDQFLIVTFACDPPKLKRRLLLWYS